MRALLLVLGLAVVTATAASDSLSPADREALLGNLEKLRGTATARVDARFRAATVAYREAMASEEAAVEFYLKCVEKVNFENRHRKASEFRDWKKQEDERLAHASLRRALMHQLRWLVLTLQAASEDAAPDKLAPEGQQIIDSLFSDAATLASQQEVLGQSVITTVFARAYDVDRIKLKKWPFSPLHIDEVYDVVLLPQYRAAGDLEALRGAWLKRIRQAGVMFEESSVKSKTNGRNLAPETGRPAALEKFLTETLPDLQWQMEMDLFRNGDQRAAALRMVAHIEKHLTHARAREWSDELKAILSPVQLVTPAPGDEPPLAPKPTS
jgi:hypothetical protein